MLKVYLGGTCAGSEWRAELVEKLNDNNDPRKNLLSSLKPYLRDSKKEKLDQYANLLNVAKIADLFKNDSKENK